MIDINHKCLTDFKIHIHTKTLAERAVVIPDFIRIQTPS